MYLIDGYIYWYVCKDIDKWYYIYLIYEYICWLYQKMHVIHIAITYMVGKVNLYGLNWLPWFFLWSEIFFLQFILIYVIYLIITNSNLYYVLLYLFCELFFIGLFILVVQLELFTGFLWVIECTVIFISILLLFYLNNKGSFFNLKINTYKFNLFYIYLVFFFLPYTFCYEVEEYLYLVVDNINLWDDFFESVQNSNTNDFVGLLLSYYYYNSFEFLLIGFLLLVGSVVCVNLFRSNNKIKLHKYGNFLSLFSFFQDMINFVFMRKQNLSDQQRTTVGTGFFKKKKNVKKRVVS